jgi:hypothetical protein
MGKQSKNEKQVANTAEKTVSGMPARRKENPKIKIFFRIYAMVLAWILSSYTFYNLDKFRKTANEKGIGDAYLNFLYTCLAVATIGVTYLGFKAILYPDTVGKMTEGEVERKSGLSRAAADDKKEE